MYQVKLSSYPNGENRLVLSKLRGSREVLDDSESCGTPDSLEALPEAVSPGSSHLTLDLNSTPEFGRTSKRMNSGEFTLDARRKILRAGGALSSFDPAPNHCLFLTGTLPGSTEDSYHTIAEYSSEVVHRLKKWVTKRYSTHQFSFYCWELQKRGALHLHYLLYCPDVEARRRIICEFKSFWISLLVSISEKSGVDLFEKSYGGTHQSDTSVVQAYAQECYKSVAAYMAKYVGKTAGKGDRRFYPSRWSSVSRPLGKLIEQYSEETVKAIPGYKEAVQMYYQAKDALTYPEGVSYSYRHKVGLGDTHITYYKADKDEQKCQYQQVSEMMNSKRSVQESSSTTNKQGLISICSYRAISSVLSYFQDCNPCSDTSDSKPLTILQESLKESFTENRIPVSSLELRNLLTVQYRWMWCVSSNTPISATQINFQAQLLKSENEARKQYRLRTIARLEEETLRNVKIRLTQLSKKVYRSTTTGLPDRESGVPQDREPLGGVGVAPSQGTLF